MKRRWMMLAGLCACAVTIGACSSQVKITPDPSGGSGSQGSTGSQGSGGSSAQAHARMVTAETDIAQYLSGTVDSPATAGESVKVAEGPFFLTDALGDAYFSLYIVSGGGCPSDVSSMRPIVQAPPISFSSSGYPGQIHGIRLAVQSGQSLCSNSALNFVGFRPY